MLTHTVARKGNGRDAGSTLRAASAQSRLQPGAGHYQGKASSGCLKQNTHLNESLKLQPQNILDFQYLNYLNVRSGSDSSKFLH